MNSIGNDANKAGYTARFVINGIYIYKEIIVQIFVIPTPNCVVHAGKPA